MKEGINGVSSVTPANIQFGAGTIHKGLTYTTSGSSGSWNFAASCVGATSGGSKLSIVPEVTKVEIDGANVATKGLEVKTGETATMQINFIELNTSLIKAATMGKDGTSEDSTNYDLVESKASIETGDYWTNIAFVGVTTDGRKIIAILENALCTSGFEIEGKNKEAGIVSCTFECHADPSSDMDKLPWKIYYPKALTSGGSGGSGQTT
ncbi:hypothetical protein [Treponema sp.]|uniref:hypothetical protein n=1 Tax=Treponema sp. TaxID=166 RepID=UPI00388D9380